MINLLSFTLTDSIILIKRKLRLVRITISGVKLAGSEFFQGVRAS